MDTLKIKTANSDHVLFLFQYFVHSPGVVSTARSVYSLIKYVYEHTYVE